jgi:hypothetical protein
MLGMGGTAVRAFILAIFGLDKSDIRVCEVVAR